jgi:acetyl-CoA acetyltransferase
MPCKAEIPYGCYWSTPFARWQGAFASLNAIEFAAHVARRELARRNIPGEVFDHGVLGFSVPQKHSFYGLPWFAGLAGLGQLAGPTLMQACSTGVRALLAGVQEIESGLAAVALSVTCDRTSNGPHLYYPDPRGPGGTGAHEDWVMDNFGCDPLGRHAMVQTAENVAAKHGISTSQQHEVVLRREAQYKEALADDRAFHRRFMSLPFDVPDPAYRKTAAALDGDEGIRFSTADGLARLKPVVDGGTVTYGGQTHPADGNAGIVLASPERARELSRDPRIRVRLLGFGQSRAALAFMPEAPVPAANRALAQAGLAVRDLQAVKTHNPFAVNDVLLSRLTGVDLDAMNNYGCSLVWGHPQSPMATRAVIELVEELASRGGGRGLFTGCAAGDTAMAVVVQVGD